MSEPLDPTQRYASGRPTQRRRLWRLLRAAAAHRRSAPADTVLAVILTFIAGAINAGGFLAIGQYTSHMTGIVSAISDHLVLGTAGIVGAGLVSLAAFVAGASCSAILINWGRRNTRKMQYAYPITLEAVLLLVFGVVGISASSASAALPLALPLLCFIMGLQNATITKLSGARIRTTHVTGMVTDIGIEVGKLFYVHDDRKKLERHRVFADRKKLSILISLVLTFLIGGIIGAFGFSHFGFIFCVPLSLLLLLLTFPQIRSI